MAVKFTTLIKMDMDRDLKKEEYIEREGGCIEEGILIWDYHVEVPRKEDETENAALIKALDETFLEEDGHKMTIKNRTICFKIRSALSGMHVTIEDLYDTVEEYVQYLEEVLEEHEVQYCKLTLELYSDISFYIYG